MASPLWPYGSNILHGADIPSEEQLTEVSVHNFAPGNAATTITQTTDTARRFHADHDLPDMRAPEGSSNFLTCVKYLKTLLECENSSFTPPKPLPD
jgi:hypothetical protein